MLRTPGRKKQTVTESSFDVWIKYNKPNENTLNAVVNYYVKGKLIGLIFDLALRLHSNNKTSLDDVMRMLWFNYGKVERGVPERTIENIVGELGGKSLSEIAYNALYTTKELPLKKLLTQFGFSLELSSLLSEKDFSNKVLRKQAHQNSSFKQGIFGCTTMYSNGRVYVSQVIDGSAASEAGISANDEIVAINKLRIDNYSFDKIAKRLRVGEAISIYIFRQELLYKLKLILKSPPLDIAKISVRKNITQSQRKNIDLLLSK